jgi:hypothetical protein
MAFSTIQKRSNMSKIFRTLLSVSLLVVLLISGTGIVSAADAMAGFNSQFNGNMAGWVKRPGAAWSLSGGTTVHTAGLNYKWSTISYNMNFKNFTYSAKMKRVSTTGGASGFWFRGAPTFDTTYNAVKNGYLFLYSQNGCFSVWKHVNGSVVAIKNWTLSASIKKNNWNTLKVVVNNSTLNFYINNVKVFTKADPSFKTGQVALTMYRTNKAETLSVDWATLATIGAASESDAFDDAIEQGQVEIAPDPSQPYGPEQAPAVQ